MIEKALQLYEQLQTDLSLCQKKQLDSLEEIECCFHIAERYWAILRNELMNHCFASLQDEITFFKVIKPRFTSETEFYSLCYHAELFRIETDPAEHPAFLKRELQRLTKFERDHAEFLNSYGNGNRGIDKIWFVRNNPGDPTASSHDPLVSTLLALKRYTEFISDELKPHN